jgi:DNA polymerase III subunit epsilon
MLPRTLAFVDIETTGLSSSFDRIIEIGIVRVEENIITQTYHSLINPEMHLPPEIELITGITTQDLEHAPSFRSIKQDILETLIDATFVAHNVRFDYGFLKNEFKRENISFSAKQLCTVKLSRALYPTQRSHNLDAVIERFNIVCEQRHRALSDAKVLVSFYQKLQEVFPREKLAEAVDFCFKKPTLPVKLHASFLDNLPEGPGVYIFYDGQNMPLYVGKSINIKDRVLSHFSSDIRSSTEMNISQQIERIETITTAGELGALVLESQLIKKMLPIYNKKSRIKRELIAIKKRLTKEGFEECFLEPISFINPDELDTFLGFFRSRKQAKTFLADLAKTHSLCEKLLGIEKTNGACFAYRLGRCRGACVGREQPLTYNLRSITAFATSKILPWPFKEAIIIEEQEVQGRHEYFAVDNWCVVGNVVIDENGNKKSNIDERVTFDLDLYKILKSYLKKGVSLQQIKQVPRTQLSSLFSPEIY